MSIFDWFKRKGASDNSSEGPVAEPAGGSRLSPTNAVPCFTYNVDDSHKLTFSKVIFGGQYKPSWKPVDYRDNM
jgi:hypothetical protein